MRRGNVTSKTGVTSGAEDSIRRFVCQTHARLSPQIKEFSHAPQRDNSRKHGAFRPMRLNVGKACKQPRQVRVTFTSLHTCNLLVMVQRDELRQKLSSARYGEVLVD